ncbi:MAG: ABC transporter substrate-binding protein, partial [Promicromonosporaceae bacterium]|nr:ABC transporter substrate-binding protein [Promicromonosporaceae bacterium]
MKTTAPRFTWRRAGIAAIAALSLLGLSACGTGDDNGDAGTPATDAPATDQPVDPDPTESPAVPPVDAPTELRISVQREPAGFDVANVIGGTDAFIWASVYDRLLTQGADGTPQPQAAESWEFSPDGLTLTMTLRQDMFFANGDQVNAHHAAATQEHIRTTAGPNQAAMQMVESVEAADDFTLVFNFSAPDVGLLNSLVLANGVIGHLDYLDDPDQAQFPMGSGAYTINHDATVPGSSWTLVRRDDHWNIGLFPFETVTVTVIADATAVENAFRAGQIDWLSVDAHSIADLTAAGYTMTEVDGTALHTLRILDRAGDMVPALGDLRVRQAINYAMPREAFVQVIGDGFGTPVTQMFFPGTAAYDPALNTMFAYDLDRALELMAEAGWEDGFDVTMPSIIFTQSYDAVITQALADINIRVTWETVPPANTVSAVMGEFPMATWPEGSATPTRTVQGNFLPTSFANP